MSLGPLTLQESKSSTEWRLYKTVSPWPIGSIKI